MLARRASIAPSGPSGAVGIAGIGVLSTESSELSGVTISLCSTSGAITGFLPSK